MPKLNQKGIIVFIPLLLIFAGIIAGVYLVQHPTIFKPKAFQSNDLPLTEADNPPALIISNQDQAVATLERVFQVSDYAMNYTVSEDEINIKLDSLQMTEDESKQVLNSLDKYYLRMLMWILLDTTHYFKRPAIDPWYVLCDLLSPEVLNKVGPEPTTLVSGRQLDCSDPVPSYDQFFPTDPHIHFIYQKISAKELLKLLQWAILLRENSEDANKNAKVFASDVIPILGPIVKPWVDPAPVGSDPSETAGKLLPGVIFVYLDMFSLGTTGVARSTTITVAKNMGLVTGPLEHLGKVLVKHMTSLVLKSSKTGLDYTVVVVKKSGIEEIIFSSSQLIPELLKTVQVSSIRLVDGVKYSEIAMSSIANLTSIKIKNASQKSVVKTLLSKVSENIPKEAKLPGDQNEEIVIAYFPESIDERENVLQNGLYKSVGEDVLVLYKTPLYEEKSQQQAIPPVMFKIPKGFVGYAGGGNTNPKTKYLMGIMPGYPGLALYAKISADTENEKILESFPDPVNVGFLAPEYIIDTSGTTEEE